MKAQKHNEKHPAVVPEPEGILSTATGTDDSGHVHPPPDGGLKAWLFLMAVSSTMVITWGMSLS